MRYRVVGMQLEGELVRLTLEASVRAPIIDTLTEGTANISVSSIRCEVLVSLDELLEEGIVIGSVIDLKVKLGER